MGSYAEYAKEYVASFSLAQIALKLGDKGLQVATDALKLTGLEESKPFKPVLAGIKTIRRNARAVRRAGAKAAGIGPAKTTELDTTVEDETVGDKLSNDRIASYVSDEDP